MLRIAFDLDGTLADLRTALDRIAEEIVPAGEAARRVEARTGDTPGPPPASESTPDVSTKVASHDNDNDGADASDALTPEEEQLEPPEVRALTRREQQAIWETVRRTENFWETLGETEPGIVARIAALAEERRWEVIFLTQRPPAAGDTTQRQSQRWLAKFGFAMPSVYVLAPGASRGKAAAALTLDVLVDDRAENCLEVKVESQARAFLVGRSSAGVVGPSAKRMGIEVVETVGECLDILTAGTGDKEGLLSRIKKVFGGSR